MTTIYDAYLKHPAVQALHLRSSVAEIEAAIVSTKLVESWWYMRDSDFENIILRDVISVAQVRAIVAMLNADRYTMEGHKKFRCQKTIGILERLRAKSKTKEPFLWLRPSWYLAEMRRVICCCHQTGSYKQDYSYFEAQEKIEAKRAEARKKSIKLSLHNHKSC
jgi:hypothetical protein